jgi:transposase
MEKMDKNDVIYQRCAGVDVHKRQITVCLRVGRKTQVKEYDTFTGDLFEMADWLKASGVEMVAMESTGSYWKPLYNVFEQEAIPAMIVNMYRQEGRTRPKGAAFAQQMY